MTLQFIELGRGPTLNCQLLQVRSFVKTDAINTKQRKRAVSVQTSSHRRKAHGHSARRRQFESRTR